MKTIPTPILPSTPCPDCGVVLWARIPLIGGRECVCTRCYPVRTWSPISDAEHRAAITRTKQKAPKWMERIVPESEAA